MPTRKKSANWSYASRKSGLLAGDGWEFSVYYPAGQNLLIIFITIIIIDYFTPSEDFTWVLADELSLLFEWR